MCSWFDSVVSILSEIISYQRYLGKQLRLTILNRYFLFFWTETTASGPADGLALLRPRPLIIVVSGVLHSSCQYRQSIMGKQGTYGAALFGLGKSAVDSAWYQSESVMTVDAVCKDRRYYK